MRTGSQAFSAKVELPCRMFCGPDAMRELAGVALRIDPGSLVLSLEKGLEGGYPELGERVQLELLLPVNAVSIAENVKAKCLTLRACVTQVTEMPDGSRRIGMTFRKAVFKDRSDDGRRKPMKIAATGWKM